MSKILFINMPWSSVCIPSLGLALLSSILKQRGVEASTYYANLDFSQLLYEHFESLPENQLSRFDDGLVGRTRQFLTQEYYSRDLVDDYIFSSCAEEHHKDDDAFWDLFGESQENRKATPLWKEARNIIPAFLDACMREIKIRDCKIFGFTSMFGQNIASLMLAERIKAEIPGSIVLFGGANCQGDMGGALFRNYSQIDFLVTGEAENVVPELIGALDNGLSPAHIRGLLWRNDEDAIQSGGDALPFSDLDSLPLPDYTSYFEALDGVSYRSDIQPTVFLEQSRGCWWGQKHHCTFCGLNSYGMVYRKKSDDRCLEELRQFCTKYPSTTVHYADNILDMQKFDGFLKQVRDEDLGVSLFFEIKSNVSKDKLKALSDAGTYSVQPGIENFSDKVLKEMRKGVRGLQNVQCLKWCRQYDIEATWNLLYGFPGETKDDFVTNLEIMKSITHLDRPQCVDKIIMQRFSPNYDQALALGFMNVRPQLAYEYVYDLPNEELAEICYAFDFDYAKPPDVSKELDDLIGFDQMWADSSDPGTIAYMQLNDGGALVVDTRFNVGRNIAKFSAPENRLLRYLDKIRPRKALVKLGEEEGWTAAEVSTFIESLRQQRFVVSEGERFLSVIPLPDEVDVDLVEMTAPSLKADPATAVLSREA